MIRKMSQFYTLATTATTAVSTPVIKETEITILSGLQTHYVSLNGTATSTSIVIPQGAVVDFVIPIGSTISALTHNGQGHITVLY